MIVNDLDFSRAILGPAENYAPLGVNTNAIEALEFAQQWFKPIAWRGAQVIKNLRSVQNVELVQCELVYLDRKLSGIATGYARKRSEVPRSPNDAIIYRGKRIHGIHATLHKGM